MRPPCGLPCCHSNYSGSLTLGQCHRCALGSVNSFGPVPRLGWTHSQLPSQTEVGLEPRLYHCLQSCSYPTPGSTLRAPGKGDGHLLSLLEHPSPQLRVLCPQLIQLTTEPLLHTLHLLGKRETYILISVRHICNNVTHNHAHYPETCSATHTTGFAAHGSKSCDRCDSVHTHTQTVVMRRDSVSNFSASFSLSCSWRLLPSSFSCYGNKPFIAMVQTQPHCVSLGRPVFHPLPLAVSAAIVQHQKICAAEPFVCVCVHVCV